MRFSLPSQLLEPTPNLEYWNYLDSPNAFVAIGTADDPVDRMLEVLRFWFTANLKYAKGKPCKPYNSCLGEFFRVGRRRHYGAPQNVRDKTRPVADGITLVSAIGRQKMTLRGSTQDRSGGATARLAAAGLAPRP